MGLSLKLGDGYRFKLELVRDMGLSLKWGRDMGLSLKWGRDMDLSWKRGEGYGLRKRLSPHITHDTILRDQ